MEEETGAFAFRSYNRFGIGLKCAVIMGGVDTVKQSIALGKRPHVVVAMPGRLLDHLTDKTKGFSLRKLKYLVLDEVDRFLNEDFQESLDKILSQIPRDRRTFLFSATMTNEIVASPKYSTVDTLKQQYCLAAPKHKDCYLVHILTELSGSTPMVFTRTCDATMLLAYFLRNLSFRVIPINGHMTQSKRLGALNIFKVGECNILVCTDVASRGLDMPSVDVVINCEIPLNPKDYIHRVGRTARAGLLELAITMVNQYDIQWYKQIEEHIGKMRPEYPTEKDEVLLLMERVREAKRIAQMKFKDARGKKRRRGDDDGEEDVSKYLNQNKGRSSKRANRRKR